MHIDNLEKMVNSAMIGSKDIYAILNKYIKENISSLSKNFGVMILKNKMLLNVQKKPVF
jgi:hypothetical protein